MNVHHPISKHHEDLPPIEDTPEPSKSRTAEFRKKFTHLDLIPLDKSINIEGFRTKWQYVVREFNRLTDKEIKIIKTVDGLRAKRVL